jgi:mono/diheme cytochrome c family protein
VWLFRTRRAPLTADRVLGVAAAAVAAGLVLVGLDAAFGGSSHVTDALGGGPGELAGDLGDRLRLSWERVTGSWGPAIASAIGFSGFVWLVTRRRRGALTDAMLSGIAVSLLVNDTPSDVVGVGAAATFAVYRWERASQSEPDTLRAMSRTTAALALLFAGVTLVLAGCGGGDEASPTPETVVGTIETETTGGSADLPALDLEGDAANGKQLYAANGCGGCHTLADAGSTGNIGPNLDDSQPDYELAVTRVTNGQGAMPAFGDRLEPQEIADVAQYVVDAS